MLETLRDWPAAFQRIRPHLKQPPYGSEQPPYVGKWIVGVESIPTSVHKAFVSILAKCMRTVSQTSHNITAPSLSSPLARTTQKLASISGPATSEVPTYVGEWLVEVEARQTIVTQEFAGLYGGIGSVFSQHSHSITAHFISSACSEIRQHQFRTGHI